SIIQNVVAQYYTLASCEAQDKIAITLPNGCLIDGKLEFGTDCPTYRIKCVNKMTGRSMTKFKNTVGGMQEDPIVQNIAFKKIVPGTPEEFKNAVQEQVGTLSEKLSVFNDTQFQNQWNLISLDAKGDIVVGFDNNFGPLLAANIRGQGIQVMLLDDGLDIEHTDIKPNYNSNFLMDFSGLASLSGPHGTSCGGLIAAAGGNNFCIVGGAPLAKLGSWYHPNESNISVFKMYPPSLTESQLAQGLMAFLSKGVHIYSNSWGAADDGKTTGAPSAMQLESVKRGSTAVSRPANF
ncbi:hypothetical protein Ciccas_014353, partial [Cichlidogyrus casuarinus]